MHRTSVRNAVRNCAFSLLFLAGLGLAVEASAQAFPTASKSSGASAFAGFTYASPDFGEKQDMGITAGAYYTRYFGLRIAPSLEARANYYTGSIMAQQSAMGGFRVQTDFLRRYHPYAGAYYGGMKITFKLPLYPGYTTDTGPMIAYGGGVNIDATPRFQVMVDFLQENANFGPNGTQPGNADFTLAPRVLSVGVNYRFSLDTHKHKK